MALKFDTSKILVEIFDSNGTKIKDAALNTANNFYAYGLIPGQAYYICFSYDGAYFASTYFVSTKVNGTVWLSPDHFVFNHKTHKPTATFVNSVKGKVKVRQAMGLPLTLWEKYLLDIIAREGKQLSACGADSDGFFCYVSGKDLADTLAAQ
jgi:hypothetical protein